MPMYDAKLKLEDHFGTTTQHAVVLINQVKPERRWHADFMSWLIASYSDEDAHKQVYVVPGTWREHLDPVVFSRHNVVVAHDGNGPGNPVLGRSNSSTGTMIYLDVWPYLKMATRFNSSSSDPTTAIFNQLSAPAAKKIIFVTGRDYFEKLQASCNVALVAELDEDADDLGGAFNVKVIKDTRRKLQDYRFLAPRSLPPYTSKQKQLEKLLREFCECMSDDDVAIISGGRRLNAIRERAMNLLEP